ncbi:sulfite oxidase [Clostridium formicaceticum]|uniref:Sulfite oxidase n=1 Tax=Clostridium formicaceticum TaxID=1497 RepID=A0AAC9WI63_9CLOT|nr:sulfite oxidase [Clostridium formicaceticum]AOY77867.1 sulfite oxidase [Clostridium formicaceticum]ARE88485.1 TMAO/DMSO reductase [Clostridium formicaceticum]
MKSDISYLYKPYLHTRELMPENQETPIHFLNERTTPIEYIYKRNHFLYPALDSAAFFLPVVGEVERPMVFPYNYIKSLPSKTIKMVLECAGNKRAYFDPKTYGEQWKDGAISQVAWKGVSLKDLLYFTGIRSTAIEVAFEGYDYGTRKDIDRVFPYARSLPLEKALHPDTIIAYELNSQPIPYDHGYPLRLVVPQWYGMASVKWLKEIRVIDHKFTGPFQAIDYVYYPNKEDDFGKKPVTEIKVNSIIQQPMNYSVLDTGSHSINGIAWSGHGTIKEVELSFDQGLTWKNVELYQDKNQQHLWTFWKYAWTVEEKGEHTIMCRAKDSYGNIQPLEAEWNRKGYGYNAVYIIKVKIE